jgi:hypothetical protein
MSHQRKTKQKISSTNSKMDQNHVLNHSPSAFQDMHALMLGNITAFHTAPIEIPQRRHAGLQL